MPKVYGFSYDPECPMPSSATVGRWRPLRMLSHGLGLPGPEQQERVLGQFAFDAAILRHHGSQLGFGGHR